MLCLHVALCPTFMQCSWRPEEGVDSSELELKTVWTSCGCWKLNLGPLEEQQVLLISEPRLSSGSYFSTQCPAFYHKYVNVLGASSILGIQMNAYEITVTKWSQKWWCAGDQGGRKRKSISNLKRLSNINKFTNLSDIKNPVLLW